MMNHKLKPTRVRTTGLLAFAVMAAATITTASAAPGDGPPEVRPNIMEQQRILPRTEATNVTLAQAVNVAQSTTERATK